jgi:protoheme IX farnesyltransferase
LKTDAEPGTALRLMAFTAAASCLLAVLSGAEKSLAVHRLVAPLAIPPLLAVVAAAVVSHRRLLPSSLAALLLLVAAAVFTAPPIHTFFAALALASSCVLATESRRGTALPPGTVRDYVALTKPRIMSLLVVTGACAMVIGARGWPGTFQFAASMLGLALACGGASALNHLLDRDIDRLMGPRTAGRPVASGRVSPSRALEFGLTLAACSFTLLASTVNLLTAVLALAGGVFYVVVYTAYLKRRGPGNIVIRGVAGAVPPLVGYAAATGHLALPALCLFLIVFLWTPPHFWALALLLRRHYEAAGVPMLPVVRGERVTVQRILASTLVLVAVSLMPFGIGAFGLVYFICALALGGAFIAIAGRLAAGNGRRRAALTFHYSLVYIALLFVAAAIDTAA